MQPPAADVPGISNLESRISNPFSVAAESTNPRSPGSRTVRVIRRTSFQAEKSATPKAKSATPKARVEPRRPANLDAGSVRAGDADRKTGRRAELPDLSYRAVREALRAGPPVVPTNPTAVRRASVLAQQGIEEGSNDLVSPRVVANLVELERLWEQHHAPAGQVYEVLRAAVLPAARPSEIFLYAPPPSPKALLRTRSAGSLLAAWAVRAGKAGELKVAIAQRQGQPLAELPAAILSAQLAIASNDAAGTVAALKLIATRLKRDTLRSTAELACHAALPALKWPQPEVASVATEVLASCAKGFEGSAQPEPLATLLLLLARRQFQLGDAPGARQRLEAYIETMEKNASRYGGGDHPVLLRKQQFQRVASEYARAGLWRDALAVLGKFVDTPAYSGGDPPVTGVLDRIIRQLAARPPGERYATLHDWTMPAKDRRVVRILASLGARDLELDVFAQSRSGAKPDTRRSQGFDEPVVSTAAALIDAAREAGTLDQLAEEARAAADQKIENGEALDTLIEIANGHAPKVIPRIEARLTILLRENQEKAAEKAGDMSTRSGAIASNDQDRKKSSFPWTDYLVARSLLRGGDASIAGLARRLTRALTERAEQVNDWAMLARLNCDLAEADAYQAGAPKALATSVPTDWHAADTRTSEDLLSTGSPTYWIAHQGYLAHPAGSAYRSAPVRLPARGLVRILGRVLRGSLGRICRRTRWPLDPALTAGRKRQGLTGWAERDPQHPLAAVPIGRLQPLDRPCDPEKRSLSGQWPPTLRG